MLIISIVCLLAATLILAVTSCFSQKNSPVFFLVKTSSLIALACLAIVCANYKNAFGGYSILIILSILPIFLTIYDLKAYIDEKNSTKTDEETFAEEQDLPKKQKKESKLLQSNGRILTALAFLLGSVCLSIAGLYKGVETFYSFTLGISIGLALTFLTMIVKKKLSLLDMLAFLFTYISVGILISQIMMVLIYSTVLSNLVYCAGALILSAYILLKIKINGKFLDLLYYLGMICMIASIIV